MFLSDFSIKRPIMTAVAFIVLLVLGILSYTTLPINDQPAVDFPYITVTVIEPGATPDQIETNITKQVEDAVGQISGVKHISSTITDSASTTVVEFGLDKSPDVANQEVKDKVSSVRGSLPSDAKDPVITKLNVMAAPILSIVINGNESKKDLSDLANNIIVKKLNAIDGVGSVNVYGNVTREIQIKVDKDKMAQYKITTNDVISGLRSDNIDMSSGKVSNDDSNISLTTSSGIKNVSDFNNVLIKTVGTVDIHLGDVAEVIDGLADLSSLSYYDGKEAIGIDITKQTTSNTVTVAKSVRTELLNIQKQLPEGVYIQTVKDNSISVQNSVDDVIKTMLEGCLFAILVVFIFLREWRSTLITAVSLPTSIIGTFIALKLLKFSLDQMSLMALTLAVGLLVDDAIVVIENIIRHMDMGKSPLAAAKEATAEIGAAVTATTFAVVAVFIPVTMVSGMIGKFFIEFGLTVAFSMILSLIVSFTLVPVLAAKVLKHDDNKKHFILIRILDRVNVFFDFIAKKYQSLLSFVLKKRLITIIIVMVLFVLSLGLAPFLGVDFLPSGDNGQLVVTADLDAGISLPNAEKKSQEIYQIIMQNKDVKHIYTNITNSSITMNLEVTDSTERTKSLTELAGELREPLTKIAGINITIGQSNFGQGGKSIVFNITGHDRAEVLKFANDAMVKMKNDPHATDVGLDYKAGSPVVKVVIDRNKAADLGVNIASIGTTINTYFGGTDVGHFNTNTDKYNIRVSLIDSQKVDISSLNNIYVTNSKGQMVPLDQVTTKEFSTKAATLHRYDRSPEIQLSCNIVGIPAGDFTTQFTNIMNTGLSKPEEVNVAVGGSNAEMASGIMGLAVALLMGIMFIYLIMAAQFESFIIPISIMFSLPLAVIGAIIGLFVCGDNFGIVSMIGIIMLMGLVAKNAILIIDFTLKRRKEGEGRTEALLESAYTRFRPIVMTSLAMVFGMMPAAMSTGAGSELRAPMAHAVIGGLITSTLLTLVVVPIMYSLLDDLTMYFSKKK